MDEGLQNQGVADPSLPSAWPLAGYAPGGYCGGPCVGCGVKLENVDKRAIHCLECAVRSAKESIDRGAKAITALRLFREFVIRNATQWRVGAGNHHHPMWAMLADILPSDDIRSGPEWRFIQPANDRTLSEIQMDVGYASPGGYNDKS
jgi:hypothetical protein